MARVDGVIVAVFSLFAATACKPTETTTGPGEGGATTSEEVQEFTKCLDGRLQVTEFEEDDTRNRIDGSLPAITGELAADVGDELRKRFEGKADTCVVNRMVDMCVAFATDKMLDDDASREAQEACEEKLAGGGGGGAEGDDGGDGGGGDEEHREPVLELYQYPNFNSRTEHQNGKVVRLGKSCNNLGNPANCGATGRLRNFDNQMSSYRLEEGYKVIFYDQTNFRGKEFKVPEDGALDQASLKKKGFDSMASSVKLFTADGKEL